MAKDPATLWYWNDWNSGTVLMSRFLKGCYMDLLHAQFNNGPLSLEEVKALLGADFGQAWPVLQKKFSETNGLFFNERLECEKQKRKSYSESRRNNRSKKTYDSTYDKHMIPHMENENRNENRIELVGGVGEGELPDMEAGKSVEYARITLHRDYDTKKIRELWKAFCIQNDGKFYQTVSDKFSHFRNSLKNIPYEKNAKPSITKKTIEAFKKAI